MMAIASKWARLPKPHLMSFGRLEALIAVFTVLVVVLILVTVFSLRDAAEERAKAACAGARDTRQVIVDMLEFTGQEQLNPNDYTGELRQAVRRSNQRARRFREATIDKLKTPPQQCAVIEDGG